MRTQFVFHDPTGRRWAVVRRLLAMLACAAGILVVLLGLAVMNNPALPMLGLPEVEHIGGFNEVPSIIRGEKADKNVAFQYKKAAKELKNDAKNVALVRSSSPVARPVKAAKTAPDRPLVVGYYVNWDRASIVSLRLNARHLTHLAAEWLILKNSAGDLEDESDQTVIDIAKQAELPVLAMVTNFRNGWQPEDLEKILNSKTARENIIENILFNVQEHKLAGVMIDLEEAKPKDRVRMVEFIAQLRVKMKGAGLMVAQSVPSNDPAYDLRRLAELNDFIVPMVYDEHYQSGPPGPVASQEWFETQLDRLAKEAPPEKVVVGIGNYGYDWVLGARGGTEVTFNDIMAAATANKAMVQWDDDTDNPVLRYNHKGQAHEVWFLDAVSGLNQVLEVSDRGFRGVGLWRLGGEDPDLWQILNQAQWPSRDLDLEGLKKLSVQKSVNQYGEGEVIRIGAAPKQGKRNVWKDTDGTFTAQYEELPTYFVVESYGKAIGKKLAITFDDGPDPVFTPKMLEILKEKGVKATFFVVGANAEGNPELLRDIYDAGHEIGNHSYSHPNIALTSAERTRLELHATQRIIENAIGRSTILFRPPYNADSEPQTPEEIEPVLRAQELGYLTVGERIDPQDWRPDATADAIVQEVISERDNGSIVLLHDAGGDRTATVAALPKIIDHFRSEGYEFVTVGQLLGKTREEVMPLPSTAEKPWAMIEGKVFDFKGMAQRVAGIIFLSAIILMVLRSVIFAAMAVAQKQKAAKRKFLPGYHPPVSVLIAAYNEEMVIHRTVRSVLANGYENLEVVVVNDGSKDRTLQVLYDAFGNDERVTILTQSNAGKSAALNHAIRQAKNEVLVAVDADTVFGPDTIELLARHFCDERVGAVSGNAKVGNKHNWLTRFQSIEYIYGFNLDRRALDLVNAIPVVPGAVGAWRRSLVLQMGGFTEDTLAEDTDLTLAIRRAGYEVRYEEGAIAYTEAPEDVKSLAKQRFRWAFGTLQAVWKHRDATFNPKYGSLAFVALPSIWLFQVVLAAVSPFADLAMIATLISGNWRVVLLYYFAFFGVELLAGFLAYALEGENPKDLILLFPQRLFYRQLMHYVLIKSMLYAAQGRLVGWGKLERRGTVQEVV
jgi:cellulose synthase/poly-beta-1,6-N-acetylglucosamine synthase-like glycosyltransferase/peptidoglycan/xylan/chitin deacetylase (PgdA/CDA1 family)/spore germination protein YaaH